MATLVVMRGDAGRGHTAGRLVAVWLGLWGDAGTLYDYAADGTRFQLTTAGRLHSQVGAFFSCSTKPQVGLAVQE